MIEQSIFDLRNYYQPEEPARGPGNIDFLEISDKGHLGQGGSLTTWTPKEYIRMPRPHTKKGALSPALPPVRRKRSNPFNALVRRVANLSVPSADLSAQGAITGELTETAAEQIPEKVVRLSISQSAITGLTESFLRHERMANIETLKLRHNQLSDLPDSFSCLSKLVKLYLEGNCFTTFPSVLCEMKQLKVISLEHNQIRHLPDNITHLTSLEVLYLRNNRIAVLPLGLLQSTSLHKLAVDDNPLICPPLYM